MSSLPIQVALIVRSDFGVPQLTLVLGQTYITQHSDRPFVIYIGNVAITWIKLNKMFHF